MSGSGDVHIGQIDVRDLDVDMRGSGDLRVAGSAQIFRAHASTSPANAGSRPTGRLSP